MAIQMAATAVCVAGPAAASASVAHADHALDRALTQLVHMRGGPPGAAAIVHRGDHRELHRAGARQVGTRHRIRARDHMRIASVSKAFSGAVALSLVDRGTLSLGDTIADRFPDLPATWGSVTLRELLNHTSGLPDYTADPDFRAALRARPHRRFRPRRLLRFVTDQDPVFTPGSRYAYSNTDNIVVGLTARKATGHSYRGELDVRVFRPLRLRRTSLPRGFRLPRPFVHGYSVDPPHPPQDVTTLFGVSGAWASGGIQSTPGNLSRFIRAYVGGRLFGRRVQRHQLKFVTGGRSDPPGPGANAAGLAIFRYRTRCGTVYGHTGSFPGYTQFAAATRSGSRSATVSVNEQPDSTPLGRRVLAALRRVDALAVCAARAR